MTDATADQKRHDMRLRAVRRVQISRHPRRRNKVKPVSMSKALFGVRRSEILLFLSRNKGRHLAHSEIAQATAVPINAVRAVCRALARDGNDLMTPPVPVPLTPEELKWSTNQGRLAEVTG